MHIPQESLTYHCSNCAKGFEYESLLKLHVDYEHNNQGGFQLLDLIITELKSHMTCLKIQGLSSVEILFVKKMLYKT